MIDSDFENEVFMNLQSIKANSILDRYAAIFKFISLILFLGTVVFLTLGLYNLTIENAKLSTAYMNSTKKVEELEKKINTANNISNNILVHQLYLGTGFGQQFPKMSTNPDILIEQLSEVSNTLFHRSSILMKIPTFLPSEGYLSSRFGSRFSPFTSQRTDHNGLDIASDIGTPVYAAASGIVKCAGYEESFGNFIEIDHGNGFTTRYAHNSALYVVPKQKVEKGELISLVGTTGRSTGPHLHFEVWVNGTPLNPENFIYQKADESGLIASKATKKFGTINKIATEKIQAIGGEENLPDSKSIKSK